MARERDIRNAIRDALVATNQFSDVWISGLPEDRGQGASDLLAAAIEPVATLTYLGPIDPVEYGHSDPAVFFTIEQLDGSAQMTGGAADSCNVTTIGRDEAVKLPFHKAGASSISAAATVPARRVTIGMKNPAC